MKHKGRIHNATDKKLKKAHSMPPMKESLEAQAPQVPKPGTNSQNQFR